MKLPYFGILAIGIGFAALSARADQFDFSYTFASGDIVTGSLDGTVSGDLITNISNVSVSLDGNAFSGPLYAEGFVLNVGYADGAAVASLDGLQNDFLFINSDYAAGDLSYNAFFGSITAPSIVDSVNDGFTIAQAIDGNIDAFDVPASATWSIRDVSSVPDTASAMALLAVGVVGLAAFRRRWAR